VARATEALQRALNSLTRMRAQPRRQLRFAPEGKVFVGLTLGVGLAAVNTGSNLMYLVLGMTLSLIVMSGVLSELTLQRLEPERGLPLQARAGLPCLTTVALKNEKRRLPSFSVQIEDVIEGIDNTKRCYFLKLPAQARQQTSYRAEFPRRGEYRYLGFTLATRFPFGFFIKSRFVPCPGTLVVLPRRVETAALETVLRAAEGDAAASGRGVGREFQGLRLWREGDDARDVHWKRTAREGRLVMRDFAPEAARHVGLLLDERQSAASTPSDQDAQRALDDRVDLAASIVERLRDEGCAVDLCASSGHWRVEPDGRGLDALLHALALLKAAPADAPPPEARQPNDLRRATWRRVEVA
jgi:uncharacterized protein (DUF58 family)